MRKRRMISGIEKRLLRYSAVRAMARKVSAELRMAAGKGDRVDIPELQPLNARPSDLCGSRVNLLLSAVSIQHVFGGIATALALFKRLQEWFPERRIIVTDVASIALMTPMLRCLLHTSFQRQRVRDLWMSINNRISGLIRCRDVAERPGQAGRSRWFGLAGRGDGAYRLCRNLGYRRDIANGRLGSRCRSSEGGRRTSRAIRDGRRNGPANHLTGAG